VRIVPDCDHFYCNKEDDVGRLVADWLRANGPGAA
jgi:alpha/beta superfamily hydrolase